MPHIILPDRRRRQPLVDATLDWSSPLITGARAVVSIKSGRPFEFLRGMEFQRYGTTKEYVRARQFPAVYCGTESNSSVWQLQTGPILESVSNGFLLLSLWFSTVSNAATKRAVAFRYNGTQSVLYQQAATGSVNKYHVGFQTVGALFCTRNSLTTPVANDVRLIGLQRSPGGSYPFIWLDETVEYGATGTTSTADLIQNPNEIVIGSGSTTSTIPLMGGVALAVLLEINRPIYGPIVREFARNPWQIFRRAVPRTYSFPASATGIRWLRIPHRMRSQPL